MTQAKYETAPDAGDVRAYRVSRASLIEPRAVAGAVVYEALASDFGLAYQDTIETGIPHIGVTLSPDGRGPVFTMPLADLAAVVPRAAPAGRPSPGARRPVAGSFAGKGGLASASPSRFVFSTPAILASAFLLALVGVVFALFPGLDFHASDFFEDEGWRWTHESWAGQSHFLVRACFDLVIVTFVLKGFAILIRPRAAHFCDLRAVTAVLLVLLVGPSLVKATADLADIARPKPLVAITAYEQGRISRDRPALPPASAPAPGARPHPRPHGGGDFLPWFNGAGTCAGECTSISRDVAAATALLAAAAVLPGLPGLISMIAALAFAAWVSVLRIGVGEIYLSDALLAALLMHILSAATLRLFGPNEPSGGSGHLLNALRQAAATSARQTGRAFYVWAFGGRAA